jgi:putative transposase
VGRVATTASATAAKALLDKLCAEAPFPVQGIQVDGGSEFMAEFEAACAEKGLTLFVLPPKRPQLNGAVERAQGSWRYEFYGCFDLPHRIDKLQQHVDAFAHRYNHHRPHQALGDQTPAEYLKAISTRDPSASHMS